jgi:hypothetical protein
MIDLFSFLSRNEPYQAIGRSSNNNAYDYSDANMLDQPFFAFTFNCSSKSTRMGYLRNLGSNVSMIALTKCSKQSNVVLSPILQYPSHASTT